MRQHRSLLRSLATASALMLPALASPPMPQSGDEILRPDDEPPVGILGTARAATGAVTITWTWTGIERSDIRDGDQTVTRQEVFDAGYEGAVVLAKQEEHRLGFHFEPAEGMDLDLVLPYRDARMNISGVDGTSERLRENGLGDLEIGALWTEDRDDESQFTYGLALGIPTGATDLNRRVEGADDEHLPYFVQPGTAAWSVVPRAYMLSRRGPWSWGYGGQYCARFGEGGEKWNKDDVLQVGAWAANRLTRDTSVSLRIQARHDQGIRGRDPQVDPTLSTLHDPKNYGGTLVRLFLGVNHVEAGGHRIAAELGVPLHENVAGIQLSTGMTYSVGWRYSF